MNSVEQKIGDAISGVVELLGYNIVRIRMTNSQIQSDTKTLEILIEKKDGDKISIGDCKKVNNAISVILDVEDIISHQYNLEVSSPGIERPLITLEDFVKFQNHVAQIKLHKAMNESKKYIGRIQGVRSNEVVLLADGAKAAEVIIEFDNIKDAKLVLTDELFRQLMRND